MLINTKSLATYKLLATDGEIGAVKQFIFDSSHWTIHFIGVDTGNWLIHRQILISPHAVTKVNQTKSLLELSITKKQVEDSPPLEIKDDVTETFAMSYHKYYAFPIFWGSQTILAGAPYASEKEISESDFEKNDHRLADLRSTETLQDYDVETPDGSIGLISNFIVDDENWVIRYLVITLNGPARGKQVLLSPDWVERVSWQDSKVVVALKADVVNNAPAYDENSEFTLQDETSLRGYYQQNGNWTAEKPSALRL